MPHHPIIVTRHLSHRYITGSVEKYAIEDITLEIARGSCVAIVGVNGSGKTTLVQHFNGLLRPTSGTVLVDGIDLSARGVDLRAVRQRVGLLFQLPETQLFGRTVYEDVAFGPRRQQVSRHDLRARVLGALETVGLPPREYAHRSPFELSGGQRRRVALAGVLAMQPQVLVLDEVSMGLDGQGRAELYHYLQRLREERGVTLVLVSHDMAEVASLAEWLFVLHEGHLVLQGSPRAVFSQPEVLRQWGLAAPPLSELLLLLRKQGVALPQETFTLDEVVAALRGHASSRENMETHP